MKFSIVTISFNQARFLEQALRSVLEQDYPHVEYIVVDPGSTDGSRDIIERYRRDVDLVLLEPDRGPADGLNKGFDLATGEIFGFINSDDYLLPGALTQVASAFQADPAKDILSGHALVVDEAGREINRFYSRRFSPTRQVYGAASLAQQATFFRSSAFRQVGGFNSGNRLTWDGELWLDMALRGARFGRLDKFLAAFRIYGDSITGSMRYADSYSSYREAAFKKVMGRDPVAVDRLMHYAYKGAEYLSEPRHLRQRLLKGPVVGASRVLR